MIIKLIVLMWILLVRLAILILVEWTTSDDC